MLFTGIVLTHLLLFSYSPVECGLLIPEELPSFLSLLYSIVPPLRIGKDSRFGAGFRIGPNADLQFLVELGPQQNTLPIGPGPSGDIDDALPGVRRHVASSTTLTPPPRRRPSPTRNNWGLNYIPNRRHKEPINQTVPNNSKSETTKLFWRGKSQSQNDVKHQTSASIQRKIVRLPDSLIVYNTTQKLATNSDVEMINNLQENYGAAVSVEDRNKVQKLKNKEQSTNTLINNGFTSNHILEESIQNRTSAIKSEKKRNEQLQQQTNQRPRALRDWVFSWFDGLKPPKSTSA
ncbi:uncharacterized protein LOC111046249 [Nilaparvata lugens]|uniref:uncharacterized protein LOC111046249 n=1 Tax=Nilaparvata lugens TaxID=108931 RepID=UPI00193D1FD3|nr:uncharacterized protein LOC111046249 [Nilaparvata lugens]